MFAKSRMKGQNLHFKKKLYFLRLSNQEWKVKFCIFMHTVALNFWVKLSIVLVRNAFSKSHHSFLMKPISWPLTLVDIVINWFIK